MASRRVRNRRQTVYNNYQLGDGFSGERKATHWTLEESR